MWRWYGGELLGLFYADTTRHQVLEEVIESEESKVPISAAVQGNKWSGLHRLWQLPDTHHYKDAPEPLENITANQDTFQLPQILLLRQDYSIVEQFTSTHCGSAIAIHNTFKIHINF